MRGSLILILTCATLAGMSAAMGQPYPARPVTLIVPYGAGGPLDTLTRIVSERMRASLGQPMVIENVTGASGMSVWAVPNALPPMAIRSALEIGPLMSSIRVSVVATGVEINATNNVRAATPSHAPAPPQARVAVPTLSTMMGSPQANPPVDAKSIDVHEAVIAELARRLKTENARNMGRG